MENTIMFEKIKELVLSGLTIDKACKSIGVRRDQLYKHISEEQKKELKVLKVSKSSVSYSRHVDVDVLYFINNNEENF